MYYVVRSINLSKPLRIRKEDILQSPWEQCAGGEGGNPPLQDFGKNISKTFQSPLITIFQIFRPSYGSVLMCLWAAKLVRQTKAQLRCPIFTQNQIEGIKMSGIPVMHFSFNV